MVQAHEFFAIEIIGTDAPPVTPDPEAWYISGDITSSPGGAWTGFIPPFLANIPNGVDWNTKPLATRSLYYDTQERQLLSWDGTALFSPVGGIITVAPNGATTSDTDFVMDATFQSIGLTVTGVEVIGGSVEVGALASAESASTFEVVIDINGTTFIGPIDGDVPGYFPFEGRINHDQIITAADVIDVKARETSGAATNPFIRGSIIESIFNVDISRAATLATHGSDHTVRGSDPFPGDIVDVGYVPTGGYVPAVKAGITATTAELTSHLNGISLALQRGIITDCILDNVGQTEIPNGGDADSATLTITQSFTGVFQVVFTGFMQADLPPSTTVTFNLFINGIDANNTFRLSFSQAGSDFADNFTTIADLIATDTLFVRMTAETTAATLDNTIVTDVAAGTLLCAVGINTGGTGPISSAWTTITAESGTDLQAIGPDTLQIRTGQGLRTENTATDTIEVIARDTPLLGTVRALTLTTVLQTGTKYVLFDISATSAQTLTFALASNIEDGSSVLIRIVGASPLNVLTLEPFSAADTIDGQTVFHSDGEILAKLDTTPTTPTWRIALLNFQTTRSDGPHWRAGGIMYYSSTFSGRQLTTVQKAAGQVQFVPFNVPNTVTLTTLKFEVTTFVGGSFTEVGIYLDSTVTIGEPGEKIFSSAISTGSVGVKTVSITTPFTLDPGTYWHAISPDDAGIAFQAIAVAAIDFSYGAGAAATPMGTTRTARIQNTTAGTPLPQTAAPTGHNTADQPLVGMVTV